MRLRRVNTFCFAKTKKDPDLVLLLATDSVLLQLEHQDRICAHPHCSSQSSGLVHTLRYSFGQEDPRAQGESLLLPYCMK